MRKEARRSVVLWVFTLLGSLVVATRSGAYP
jgi:hypothetical protein